MVRCADNKCSWSGSIGEASIGFAQLSIANRFRLRMLVPARIGCKASFHFRMIMRVRFPNCGVAPLRKAALLARKLVRPSVLSPAVAPLLLSVGNFRD